MDAFARDIVSGIRQLQRRWSIALIVVLSIAIGVSASASVFSWLDSIVLNPFPSIPDASRLVSFSSRTQSGDLVATSYRDYVDYRDTAKKIDSLIAFQERAISYGTGEGTRRVWAMFVSGNFFDALGSSPAMGRFFVREDLVDQRGGPALAVVSHAFWVQRLGGAPDVIGKTLSLNQQSFKVIGVGPPGFKGTISGLSFDVWLPLLQQDTVLGGDGGWIEDRKFRALHVMGRLASGSSIEAANTEMVAIAARLARDYPVENAGMSVLLAPLQQAPYGAQSLLADLLTVLLLGSFVVILIVCANTVNLLLVRTAEREREIAVRMALGASRQAIVRQLLTEGLVMSLLAALVSLWLVYTMSDLLRFFVPRFDLPVSLNNGFGVKVIGYAVLVALLAGLLSGVAPALRAAALSLGSALKDGGRGSSSGRDRQRTRNILVVLQIALAFVALAGASLFSSSFQRIIDIDPGFTAPNVLVVSFTPSAPGSRSGGDMLDFARRARQELQTIPSVRKVSYAEFVPLGLQGGSWEEIKVEAYAARADEDMKIYRNFVSPDYFETMGIGLVEGRDFTDRDDSAAPAVAVVNETFVKRYFAGSAAVGRRIAGWGKVLSIVGVVRDSKYASLTEAPRPYLYVPFAQFAGPQTEVALHVNSDALTPSLLPNIRQQIDQLGSSAYVAWALPLAEYIEASVFSQRLIALLLIALGLTALILAAIGIYGVMSHSVVERTHEIGIRMALGQSPAGVMRLIVREGLQLTVVGLLIGALVALAGARLVASLLYGADALQVTTFLGVAAVLIVVACVAATVPAYRAGRLEPLVALRLT